MDGQCDWPGHDAGGRSLGDFRIVSAMARAGAQPVMPVRPGVGFLEGDFPLRSSEARFRALTELTSDWYWEQDAQLRFIHIGDGLPENSRLAGAGLHGGYALGIAPRGRQLSCNGPAIAHRLAARKTFHEFEMQRPTRDGGWVWISVSGVPIVDALRRVPRLLGRGA